MLYHITDFSPAADNATPAIAAALAALRQGDALCLDGLELHCRPEGAYAAFYAISNNDAGEKPIAFPLVERRDITVDGAGARLVFHGRVLPFAIDRCQGVTVQDLTIDYGSPWYAQPLILEAQPDRVLLRFDSPECGCRVQNGHFCFYSRVDGWQQECEKALTLQFDTALVPGQPLPHATHAGFVPSAVKPPYFPYCGEPCDHGFLGGMFRDVTLNELAPDLIEMRGDFGFTHTVGSRLIMTHSSREFPGVFLTDSKDTLLQDINLTYTSSMGVVGQMCENITLRRVVAAVEQGSHRVLSVNADATHFVNCRGQLTMQDCKFTNMMDDACNIHGIYGILQSAVDERTLSVTFGHFQQEGICFVKPGDTLAIIDRTKTEVLYTLTAAQARLLSMKELQVTFADELPAALLQADFASGDLLLENLTANPVVTITGCESGYNRPRGFLISTSGKTHIENCTFYNMNTGVQIGGEMRDWYESGAVTDVTVTDCDFACSAYAGGVAIDIDPKLVALPQQPFHERVTVQNCRFTQCHPRLLQAVSVRALRWQNNTFTADETLPAHPAYGENGISVRACGRVTVE